MRRAGQLAQSLARPTEPRHHRADEPAAPAAPVTPSLAVSPQPAGASVVVNAATLPGGGWLVIHATSDGKPVVPGSIGRTALKEGASSTVRVALAPPAKPGDLVIVMLHHDDGQIGVYEFGPGSVDHDKPVILDGKPVVKPMKIQ